MFEGINEVLPAGDDAVKDVHSTAHCKISSSPGLATRGAAMSGPLYLDLSTPPNRMVPVGASDKGTWGQLCVVA